MAQTLDLSSGFMEGEAASRAEVSVTTAAWSPLAPPDFGCHEGREKGRQGD